jgi:hypothetical protein
MLMPEVPEWVFVWKWVRETGDWRSFPQQWGFVDSDSMMKQPEYDELHKRWLEHGAPHKASNPLADIEIPF